MKLVEDDDERKVLVMEKPDYQVEFTVLNMNSSDSDYPVWKTISIKVTFPNSEEFIYSEFLLNEYGAFEKQLIKDEKDNSRVIEYLFPHEGIAKTKSAFVSYLGKGLHFKEYEESTDASTDFIIEEEGSLIRERYFAKGIGDFYYDEETEKLIDDSGNMAPSCRITKKNLGTILKKAAESVSKKVKEAYLNQQKLDSIPDIEFGEV